MIRYTNALVALCLTVASCGLGDDGSIDPNAWQLAATSPDQTQLLVTTNYGGAASECARFEGWQVTETEQSVEILAMLWTKNNPRSCTDDLAEVTVSVQLDQPLGARDLVGCGTDDCSSSGDPVGGLVSPEIASNGAQVLVGNNGTVQLFDHSGTLLSTETDGSLRSVIPVGDMFVSSTGGAVVGHDYRTDSAPWTVPGQVGATSDGVVYTCVDTDDGGTTSQIAAATGELLWSVPATCEFVVPAGDNVVVLGRDPSVDGGSTLVVVDVATGTELARRPFDDGRDDQVHGVRGMTRVGDHVVAFGWQADTIVMNSSGDEVARRPDRLGAPVGATNDTLVTALEQELLGTDPLTGDVVWSLDRRHAGGQSDSFILVGDTLWLPEAGMVTRIDANTGLTEWSTPTPLTSGTSLAVTADAVYVAAPLSLTALDRESGAQLWSIALPWSGEVIAPAVDADS